MLYETCCRTYQQVLYIASPILPWRKPELLEGPGCLQKLPARIEEEGLRHPLIVTDPGIKKAGLLDRLTKVLDGAGISYAVYAETIPDPTDETIEKAYELYKQAHCDGLIALGGGSSMDCAKAVGVRVIWPHRELYQMRGILKIWKALPPLFAIPTTAGTGSEATLAAVITDSKRHIKYHMDDTALIPKVAVLDPELTLGLPAHITAATGMDALTHAVEAYLGRSNTDETRGYSLKAVSMIAENLLTTYADGQNLEARRNMLLASHYAGIAFTRAYVGYVHALAHALGAKYHIPHGLANAVVLPYILEWYGTSAEKPLAELAEAAGIAEAGDTDAAKSEKFQRLIRHYNQMMDIPRHFPQIRAEDIPDLAETASHEANPLYPVPKIMQKKDLEEILHLVEKC